MLSWYSIFSRGGELPLHLRCTKSAKSKTGVVHIEEHHKYKYGRGLIKPRRSIYKAIGYTLKLAGTSLLRVYIPTLSVSLWISLQRIIWFYTFFRLGCNLLSIITPPYDTYSQPMFIFPSCNYPTNPPVGLIPASGFHSTEVETWNSSFCLIVLYLMMRDNERYSWQFSVFSGRGLMFDFQI